MYVTIAPDKIVKTSDIVGIFDLDTGSQTKTAREFLKKAEKAGRVKITGTELPKSFVVMRDGAVYLSQYAVKILAARTKYVFR